MRTLRDMWLRLEQQSPNQLGVVYGDVRRNYRQLLERGRALAAALAAKEVKQQDRVGMLAMNCAEWFDVVVACHLSGYIVSTVNFRLVAAELRFIIADANPKVLIFEEQYAGVIETIRFELPADLVFVCIGRAPDWASSYDDFIGGQSGAEPDVEVAAQDVAHLIYTSGTTGRPKGVMRSHGADLIFAAEMSAVMNLRAGGSMLLMMPLFHIGAMSKAFCQFYRGGAVHIQRTFNPIDFLEAVEREKIEATHMVPTMVQDVVNHPSG